MPKRASLLAFGAILLAGGAAPAAVELSEFQGSFDGWAWQWHIHNPAPYITPGVVTLSSERGYRDGHSLKFDMGSGTGDDGTLWIEKAYDVPPGVTTPVSVSFALFNQRRSDLNNFEVKAYIGEANPEVQADFTRIGLTNRTDGWDPLFAYVKDVTADSGRVWVAAAVRVAWETHRDYWLDHVQVSTDPRLAGDANLDGRVNTTDFAILASNFGRFYANWAWGDFDLNGVVNTTDFRALAANFGRGAAPGEVTAEDWAALQTFSATQVPEPAGLALWVVAAPALCRHRRYRGSQTARRPAQTRRPERPAAPLH